MATVHPDNELRLTFQMLHQQRLNLQPNRLMVLETFYDKQSVVTEISKFFESKVSGHLQLRGLSQTGKTHLLQGIASKYQGVYCPLQSLLPLGAEGLVGYENPPILCLDDAHVARQSASWVAALQSLISVRSHSHKVTVSSTEELMVDEVTLSNLHQLTLSPLGSLDKQAAVQLRAKYLGLKLDDASAKWLVSRYGENMTQLMKVVTEVDTLSSDAKMTVTAKRLGMLLKQEQLPMPPKAAVAKPDKFDNDQ